MLNKTKQYAMLVDYGDRYPTPHGPFPDKVDAIKEMDRRVNDMLQSNPSRRAEPNVTSPETFTIVWASEGCQRVADSVGAWYVSVREIEPPPIRCTSCSEPAVMLYGVIDEETLQVSSMNGLGHLSPSCQGCGGAIEDDGSRTIQIPLDNMTPFEHTPSPDEQPWCDA